MAWLERIKDAKKSNNITTKQMSERIGLPLQTIERILAGRTRSPYIDTVLDLGAAVGLTPKEIFTETGTVLGEQDLSAYQAEVEALKAELASVTADNVDLKAKIAAQEAELDLMRMKMDHKEQIIALHERYVRVLERDQK